MTRVDFYVLTSSGDEARHQFACRLAEKAYRLGNRIHVVTPDAAGVQALDQLLWTFRDGSFVPHAPLPAEVEQVPVTLGASGEGLPAGAQLLINLTDAPLAAEPPRIAEIVDAGEPGRQSGRQRFAAYRERGYTLETHHIG
jgi:DNA polymerase-3 subunit chi